MMPRHKRNDVDMTNVIVNDHYHITCRIGKGGFGAVYTGINLFTDTLVAVKFNTSCDEIRTFAVEERHMKRLAKVTGIPKCHWFGWHEGSQILVMDLLGPSIKDFLQLCGGRFSVKTCYLIAGQLIRRLRDIHKRGVIHFDLQPGNICAGNALSAHVLYLVDFGLAKTISSEDELGHDTENFNRPTASFGSRNLALGYPPGRVDDLQSLAYMLVFFAAGPLPWSGMKNYEAALQSKLRYTVDEICSTLPRAFGDFMQYTWDLAPNEIPNYTKLLKLFEINIAEPGWDYVLDWTEISFRNYQMTIALELQNETDRSRSKG